MSYYILPKQNIEFNIIPTYECHDYMLHPIISNSLHYYLNGLQKEYEIISKGEINFLYKTLNPYEYIFSKIPNTNLSVSKLNPFSNTFYIYIEIINMFGLMELFYDININTISYGKNSKAVVECITFLREDYVDLNIEKKEINISQVINKGYEIELRDFLFSKVQFLSYELNDVDYNDTNSYTIGLLFIICNIICYQSPNGVSIIKIDNLFYKPVLDILYILTCMYEKVYVIKPNITNIISNEKYIVCKNFNFSNNSQLSNLNDIITKKSTIKSILNFDLPYYFLNKLEECNIIIGNQQIEYLNFLLSLYRSKNKCEKLEIIQKNNINKCVQWCDKFKIPNNKFIEKLNIFLNYDQTF